MEYNIDNAELTATLTAVNLDAAVIGQAPLEVAIGESARIDVGQAINYIKTGTAEIAAAVQEGTAAFDLNAEQKTADFNDNASNKTAEYNQNADNRLSEYNANDVAKTAAFNQNASDKTEAYDNNANDKTDNYNQNAEYKTDIFNLNAITKTQAFDDNATAQTTAFNENAAVKQAAVDASSDAAAASATTAKQYAIGVPSEPSGYSAKYWAEQTAQSLSGLQSDVAGIKAVIPASATASNKLTDKSYVDTADNNLQSQIDAITASSDVTDIVGTYAELQNYDTSTLPPNSIIKVLQDESRNNETTYYRWIITGGVGAWSLIGEEGPYYTISAADAKFATQTALSTGLSGKQDTLVSGTNIKTINNQSVLGSGDLTVTASAAWGSITGTLSAQTDLQNALNAKANNADLSNYVTLNTDQTISGRKTFNSVQVLNGATLKCFNFVRGTNPASIQYANLYMTDSTASNGDNTAFGCFRSQVDSNGNVTSLMRTFENNVAAINNYADIKVIYPLNGSPYATCPTPTDTTTTTGTQIATTGWVNSTNNNVVHKTGNETINGTKTFTSDVYVSREVPRFCAKNTALTKGTAPSANTYSGFNFYDSSNNAMGRVLYGYSTTKTSSVSLDSFKANSSSDTAVAAIAIHYPASGNPYTSCPASDVNGSIVTTVNKSKAANGYFQLGNGLIIQWGTRTGDGTVTFPKAFTTYVSVSLSVNNGVPNYSNVTKTGFTASSYNPGTTPVFNWIAIGY